MPVCTRSSFCATVRYSQIHTFIHPQPSFPPTRPSGTLCGPQGVFLFLSPIDPSHNLIPSPPPILWTLKFPTLPSPLLLYVCRCVPVTVARVPRSPFSPVGSSSFSGSSRGKKKSGNFRSYNWRKRALVACIRYRYLDSSSDTTQTRYLAPLLPRILYIQSENQGLGQN